MLLVYRVDRFSRNLRDMVTLLDDLDQAGVSFRSATEPFDTSTPMGRMLMQMLGMFAQFERDTIIDRVIAGMERKAARGKWKGGRPPYGYTRRKDDPFKLVPVPGEAAVIRLIFDLYIRDRLDAKAIAHLINHRGHRGTTGKPWSGQQILRVLCNRIYLGELTFREITVTGCHEPIVDETTFAEAGRILDERGETYSHRAANGSDYHLTGLLRCPKCHKAMIGTRATGRSKTYRYYTCFSRARYGTCDAERLDADGHPAEQIADHITEITNGGTDTMRKGLIGTLIAEIKITGPNKVIPIFRVPQPPAPKTTKGPQPTENRRSRPQRTRFAQ